jgi:hypothetical protein
VPDPRRGDLTIIVDVANVMGARADGWWKDRAAAALRLCREVAALAARGVAEADLPAGLPAPEATAPGDAVPGPAGAGPDERVYPGWVLVLEGRARQAADALGVVGESRESRLDLDGAGLASVVLASGSGDDTIVRQLADLGGRVVVTTADRELRARCERAGAVVTGPRWLLGLL